MTNSASRRSDRVPIAFPVEVSGIDLAGEHFSERATTANINRFGCGVVLQRLLRAQQEVHLHRAGAEAAAIGRVVGHIGIRPEGNLYGIELPGPCDDMWGVRFSSSFYERLLDGLHEGVYFVNLERKITYWNRGAEKLAGYVASEAIGKHCSDKLLGHVDEEGRSLCNNGCPLSKTIADGKSRESEVYLRHKQGHRVPVCMRVLPMRDSAGQIIGAVEVFSDVTAKKKIETRISELEHLAFKDPLTKLPNRRYMEFKVAQALQENEQFGRKYGLLMIDVDHFKHVNDTYGHNVGDTVLRTVAETLVQGLRSAEMVGRWGGEEFLVLLTDVDAIELGDLAERCRSLVSQTAVPVGGSQIQVTVSIGGTLANNSMSAETAIEKVDELMYQSKRTGRNRTTLG